MRDVAVTEGDKVEAQIQLGYDVYGYGIGDLVKAVNEASDADVEKMIKAYLDEYDVVPPPCSQAASSTPPCAMARASKLGCATSWRPATSRPSPPPSKICTDWRNCPAWLCQRLMRDGYGFGAEGDWKTSALVRAMKVMAQG